MRRDYLGDPDVPLKQAVLDEVEARIGRRPAGAVRMLTNLRTFGYVFNPVTFYYCFEPGGELACVLAQITNTPWGERRNYVVEAGASVLLVEHDLDVIAASDWVIDLGPGGGPMGGRLVAEGPPAAVARAEGSLTGKLLADRMG